MTEPDEQDERQVFRVFGDPKDDPPGSEMLRSIADDAIRVVYMGDVQIDLGPDEDYRETKMGLAGEFTPETSDD